MTCIQKLLEIKGKEKTLLINSGGMLEEGGNYKGYDYCVIFTEMGHRCGYVALPADHPYNLSLKEIDKYDHDLEVHGGVSFYDKPDDLISDTILKPTCNDIWIGFDAAHCNDKSDYEQAKKYFPKRADSYDEIKKIHAEVDQKFPLSIGIDKRKIRSAKYMIEECKSLIDQIIKLGEK
jgi:hypothetical protein